MGGRFGKYGDLKRKAALRKSREEKGRLQKGGKNDTQSKRYHDKGDHFSFSRYGNCKRRQNPFGKTD
jgi:hypothetical protein